MPTPVRVGRRARVANGAGAVLLLLIGLGCGLRSPGAPTRPPSTTSATPSASASPSATPTPRPPCCTPPRPTTAAPAPLGDLTIHLAGPCTWYQDVAHGLWLAPTLAANWVGAGPFPANGFSMTANYGKRTAGGPVNYPAPFSWAIGGEPTAGNSFLGHTVVLTVTIDAVHEIAETNEANNVTYVSVFVPGTPPPDSGTVVSVPCT